MALFAAALALCTCAGTERVPRNQAALCSAPIPASWAQVEEEEVSFEAPVNIVPSDLAPVEEALESLFQGLHFAGVGTCYDPDRGASVEMLRRRAQDLDAEYELLTGRRRIISMTMVEGDLCVNSRYFEQNYRASSRELAEVEELMRAVRARRSCRPA